MAQHPLPADGLAPSPPEAVGRYQHKLSVACRLIGLDLDHQPLLRIHQPAFTTRLLLELGEIGLAFPHPVILARTQVQRGKASAKADTDPCVAARGERGVINCSPRYFHSLYRAKDCLSFIRCLIVRRPLHCIKPSASSSRERQSMTDLTLSISAALRDAQLQRLEASLAAKTPAKPQVKAPSSNDKGSSARG